MNTETGQSTQGGILPRTVPLFPLPDHVLLPTIPAPYRVFEPRYRALVEHLLAQPEEERWISVPRLSQGWKDDYHGVPPFHEVATLGRITTCEALNGGHFFILVEGVARVRLTERDSDLPFRMADIQILPDIPRRRDDPLVRRSTEQLMHAVLSLAQLVGASAADLTDAVSDLRRPEALVYRLGASLLDLPDDRQALLEERCILRRADRILMALGDLIALSSAHLGSPAAG